MKIQIQYVAGGLLFALLAGALTYASVNNGFTTDDHFMRALYMDFPGLDQLKRSPLESFAFSKGNEQENAWLIDKGVFPWWAVTNAKLSFFRPLAAATHWLDYTHWRDNARRMHFENVLWFALMCGLAFIVYREISKPAWLAWLAAFMYAADEIHGQAVGWISSRNTLMVTCVSIGVLIAHHRWRTSKRDRWAVAAFVLYGLGLLCGEGAIGVCAYLFAYALVMGFDTWRGRLLSLAPYAAFTGMYLVLYRVYGFGSAGSSWYADPGADFTGWLRMLATNAPILFFTESFAWPSPLFRAPWPWNALYFLLILAVIAAAIALMRPMLRSSARARFWLIGALLALVPVSSVVAQPRVLTLSALGVMGLLSEYMSGWFNARQFTKVIGAIVGMTFLVRVVDYPLRWALGYYGLFAMYLLVLIFLAALLYSVLRYGERSADWLPITGLRRHAATALVCVFLIAHLIVGPNTLTVQSMVHGSAGRKLDAAHASLPFDVSVINRDLIVLQGANDFTCYYFMLSRSSNDQFMPGHLRMLSASLRPLTIERPDASSLILRSDDGIVADRGTSIYRSRKYPMKQGDTIALTGLTATVLKTDADGWPMDAAFSFAKPLDDDLYLWYTGALVEELNPRTGRLSKVERYIPITPPAVGEKVSVQELLERSPKFQAVVAAAREARPAKS